MRILLVIFSVFISGQALVADSIPSSGIAAVVNKAIISQSDLMNRLKLAAISSGLDPSQENFDKMKPQMIRMMIDEQLQLQQAKKYKIEISKSQIKGAIQHLEESNHMKEGAVAELMETNNIPLKTLEDQVRSNIAWITLIREQYAPTLQITDWEIEQEKKAEEEKETKAQYHLAEILVPFDNADQEERVKSDVNRLIEELHKGAHFTALAQQFSTSPTAAQGGDMGWLTEDQLAPEIKEALKDMSPGQLSKPIRLSQGYLLLAFIEQKRPGAEGNILYSLQQSLLPFPKGVTEDKAREVMELATKIVKSAKSCPDLTRLAKEKYPGAESHLAEKKSIDSLPEPLQKLILPLSVNQATEPLLTEDGALLIMVCNKEKEEIKKFTEEDARNNIIERKLSLLSRRELRDLRRHAFIEMRM